MTDATMKIILTSFALLLTMTLTGCNTVKGMGQDIQKAGESIESAVKKK
jgi:predicted small secreted protein